MEVQSHELVIPFTHVKATLRLGSETHSVNATKGHLISEQLVSMKEQSMAVLKEFITKHNVPNDVPDELVEEGSSEDDDGDDDDDETPEKSLVKSKKSKLT